MPDKSNELTGLQANSFPQVALKGRVVSINAMGGRDGRDPHDRPTRRAGYLLAVKDGEAHLQRDFAYLDRTGVVGPRPYVEIPVVGGIWTRRAEVPARLWNLSPVEHFLWMKSQVPTVAGRPWKCPARVVAERTVRLTWSITNLVAAAIGRVPSGRCTEQPCHWVLERHLPKVERYRCRLRTVAMPPATWPPCGEIRPLVRELDSATAVSGGRWQVRGGPPRT